MTYEFGTNEIDEEVILDAVTYQIEGSYTNVLDCEEKDGRSNVIISDDEITFEINSVYYGNDFELTLTDQKILDELEAELYNLIYKYRNIFTQKLKDKERPGALELSIDTSESKPIQQKPYRYSVKEQENIKEQIIDQLVLIQL